MQITVFVVMWKVSPSCDIFARLDSTWPFPCSFTLRAPLLTFTKRLSIKHNGNRKCIWSIYITILAQSDSCLNDIGTRLVRSRLKALKKSIILCKLSFRYNNLLVVGGTTVLYRKTWKHGRKGPYPYFYGRRVLQVFWGPKIIHLWN